MLPLDGLKNVPFKLKLCTLDVLLLTTLPNGKLLTDAFNDGLPPVNLITTSFPTWAISHCPAPTPLWLVNPVVSKKNLFAAKPDTDVPDAIIQL